MRASSPADMRFERFVAWTRSRTFSAIVFAIALVTRLIYNLFIHPPADHVFSDMNGYVRRAEAMFDDPFPRDGWHSLYPYGTHTLLYAVQRVFGRGNFTAVAIVYALLGGVLVALTHALAKAVFDPRDRPLLSAIVALVALAHYEWLAFGSYFLSEIPFAVCLTGAALFSVRLAENDRPRDAWLLGLAIGIGATFRPQILVSAALIALLSSWRGAATIRWKSLGRAALPLAMILALSSARFYATTGTLGLVSSNGPVNLAFGRCHNLGLLAVGRERTMYFGPTSLRGLKVYERDNWVPFPLDPALGEELVIQGYLWDKGPIDTLVRRCWAATSIARQAKYSASHVLLLWMFDSVWPDSDEEQTSERMYIANGVYMALFFVPTLIAMALALRRGAGVLRLVAVHLWALIAVVVIYFGDARFRVPYDGLAFVLSIDVYDRVVRFIRGKLVRAQGP